MKKIFVLFTFMSLVSLAVNAQNCPHAKSGTASISQEDDNYAKTVATAAAEDESIKREVCSKSGTVSYSRKVVNESTDNVTYSAVKYDASTKKFVNVSPSDSKKAGCCSGGAPKSCSKAKSSSTSTSTSEDVKVKKVSNEEN